MKKAKERFDGLVEILQKGGAVNFGQMEEVFAQAFLSRFLQRLSSSEERKRADRLYSKHLARRDDDNYRYDDDEEEEELELDSEQRVRYELEVARTVIGTLGVRPTTEELSNYVQHSIKHNDWDLLDDVLSLTKEGRIGEETIGKVALDLLSAGRDSAYAELNNRFGPIKFKEAEVLDKYSQAMPLTMLDAVEALREATKVPIPTELCQQAYERMLEGKETENIERLRKISGTTPLATEKVKELLGNQLTTNPEIGDEDVDGLASLFEIYTNQELAIALQRTTLSRIAQYTSWIYLDDHNRELFIKIYKSSEHKLPLEEVQAKYAALSRQEIREEMLLGEKVDMRKKQEMAFDTILKISETTGVIPSGETLNRVYNHLLEQTNFEKIQQLYSQTGQAPAYDPEGISKLTAVIGQTYCGYVEPLIRKTDILLSALTVPEGADETQIQEILNALVKRAEGLDRFWELCKTIEDACEKHEITIPAGISTARIQRTASDLVHKINDAEYDNRVNERSPFAPLKGANLKQYNKFKSAAGQTVKECAKQIRGLRRNGEAREMPNMQAAYSKCLELLLLECEREEEHVIRLDMLQEAAGAEISPASVQNALKSYLSREREFDPEAAGNVLERIVDKTGIRITVGEPVITAVALSVLENRSPQAIRKLNYLARLAGISQLPDAVKERLRSSAVDCLTKGNAYEYDNILPLTGEIKLTDDETAQIRARAYNDLASDENHIWTYKELQKRVPFTLADESTLAKAAAVVLSRGKTEKYDLLKGIAGKILEFTDEQKETIRKGAIARIIESPIEGYSHRIETINARAGFNITATADDLRKIIDAYFRKQWEPAFPNEIAEALSQELDTEQIERRYMEVLKEDNSYKTREYAEKLRKNTGINLTDRVALPFLRYKSIEDRIEWTFTFNSAAGYVPGKMALDEMFRECCRQDYTDYARKLARIAGQKPDSVAARQTVMDESKSLENRIKWAAMFHELGSYTPTSDELESMFRQAYEAGKLQSIQLIIQSTGTAPPDEITRKIVEASLIDRSYVQHSTPCTEDTITEILIRKHGQKLTAGQRAAFLDKQLETCGTYSMSRARKKLQELYHDEQPLEKQHQEKLLQVIDNQLSKAASPRKIGRLFEYYQFDSIKRTIPGMLTEEEVRQKASKRAAELLLDTTRPESLHQGLLYTIATGVKPELTAEQLAQAEQRTMQYRSQKPYMKTHEWDAYLKMFNSWKPEGK